MVIRILAAVAVLVSAAPAWAQESAAVPEGSHLTLFALGVLGVNLEVYGTGHERLRLGG